jgi:AcrR family transcriptional regulator
MSRGDDDPTRRRIIEAAARCCADHGVDRVSLEEIATTAGVHRTTLHRHFPGGREELVTAVLDHQADEVADRVVEIIGAAAGAQDALVDTLTFTVQEGRHNRVLASLVAEPVARAALFGPAAGRFRARAAELWEMMQQRDPDAATAPRGSATAAPERVVDHLFRVVLSLIDTPGMVRSEAEVRSYVSDFVVPALLGRDR